MNNLQQKTSQESIRPTAISGDCLPIPDNLALFLKKCEVYRYGRISVIDRTNDFGVSPIFQAEKCAHPVVSL